MLRTEPSRRTDIQLVYGNLEDSRVGLSGWFSACQGYADLLEFVFQAEIDFISNHQTSQAHLAEQNSIARAALTAGRTDLSLNGRNTPTIQKID